MKKIALTKSYIFKKVMNTPKIKKIKNLFSVVLLFCLQRSISNSLIDFSKADLVTSVRGYDGIEYLEAYGSTQNELILKNKNVTRYRELAWFSMGYPRIVLSYDMKEKKNSSFIWTQEGFYIKVDMLTSKHKDQLKSALKEKHKIDINGESQILQLIPSSLKCSFQFVAERTIFKLFGKGTQLKKLPIKEIYSRRESNRMENIWISISTALQL